MEQGSSRTKLRKYSWSKLGVEPTAIAEVPELSWLLMGPKVG